MGVLFSAGKEAMLLRSCGQRRFSHNRELDISDRYGWIQSPINTGKVDPANRGMRGSPESRKGPEKELFTLHIAVGRSSP